MIATRLAEAQVATMLLTRLSAGEAREPVPSPGDAGWAFPLVGALVGLAGWAGFAISALCGLPPGIAAVIAVAIAVVLTGGLHEDGLADFADGVGGGRDRASKLAIMRDSRIGSYGVIALVAVLALRVLAMAELGANGPLLGAFVALAAASRCSVLFAMALTAPAREDGLGRMAGSVGSARLVAGTLATLVLFVPLGQSAVAVAALMALAAAATALLAERQIGGQTGDVLGAVQCVAEVAGWVALVAVAAG